MKVDKVFLKPLIDRACELIDPSKIILFGSFARGDQAKKSDIDLAFEFESENWAKFTFWVKDEFPSLREFDLIDMKNADKEILESIYKEGIILYERKSC